MNELGDAHENAMRALDELTRCLLELESQRDGLFIKRVSDMNISEKMKMAGNVLWLASCAMENGINLK